MPHRPAVDETARESIGMNTAAESPLPANPPPCPPILHRVGRERLQRRPSECSRDASYKQNDLLDVQLQYEP
ncbi:hypothetical protein ES707_07214 [subsurface metagenome]